MQRTSRRRSAGERSVPALTEAQELDGLEFNLAHASIIEETLAATRASLDGRCDGIKVARLRRALGDTKARLRGALRANLDAVDHEIVRAALQETEAVSKQLDEALLRAGTGAVIRVSELPSASTVRDWRLACTAAGRRLGRPCAFASHRTSTLDRVQPRLDLHVRPCARRRREGGRRRAARAGPDCDSSDPEPAGRHKFRHRPPHGSCPCEWPADQAAVAELSLEQARAEQQRAPARNRETA